MTNAEIAGIILGSVSSVAAIIAAWASVAERIEKRNERLALNLSPEEETIIWIAAAQPNLRIEVGIFEGRMMVSPAYESRYLVLEDDACLRRLQSSRFLDEVEIIPSKHHAPATVQGAINYTRVTVFQLTPQGRIRAREIPSALPISTLERIGRK